MTYNFQDEPAPELATEIDPTGSVTLVDGSPQGDLITDRYSETSVSVSIVPPRGWTLDSVVWVGGGSGTFNVPPEGVEETHQFSYTVSQNGTSLTDDGNHFKIKNIGDGEP